MACDGDDLAEVVLREQQLLDPRVRGSSALLEELLHPDFLEHGASGRRWDRAALIAALCAEPAVAGRATDFSAVALGDGVVLVTYRVVGPRPSLRASVWVRDAAAGWRLRFHQGTASTATCRPAGPATSG